MSTEIERHPVQNYHRRGQGYAPKTVTMAAYEVYCHVYGPQEALVTGECRGGFSTGELIAFLYARGFPKAEWRSRFEQALKGAENL
ncbi:MAG: hypothetical protein WC829_03125 [Hyphomicrobium sp.]|jgi:hypothetical protein